MSVCVKISLRYELNLCLFFVCESSEKKGRSGHIHIHTLGGGWREDVPLRRRFWPVCQVGSRPVLMHSSLARPHLAIFTPGSNNRLGILCFSISFIIIAATTHISVSARYIFIYLYVDLFFFSFWSQHQRTWCTHALHTPHTSTIKLLWCVVCLARVIYEEPTVLSLVSHIIESR